MAGRISSDVPSAGGLRSGSRSALIRTRATEKVVPAPLDSWRVIGDSAVGRSLGERRAGAKPPGIGRSPGRPLDRRVAAELGSRLGHDFSQVRVHTDTEAGRAATRLDARAFAVGQDVYFDTGKYQPETVAGRALLAHELAHTAQARGAPVADRLPYLVVSQPDSPAERGARRTAELVQSRVGTCSSVDAGTAAPAVHRQPEAKAPVRTRPVVLFLVAPTDVAGARATAENLARRIQDGRMTDDDYETLRQAGSYFTGRALAAFHSVIDSAIKDRDVLRDVRRQAPASPPDPQYVGPILVTRMKPGDTQAARRAGELHARQLRTGTVSEDLRDEVMAHIRYFEGAARNAYRAELARALEDAKRRTERHQPGEQTLMESRGRTMGEGFGPTARFEQFQTEVLPVGTPRTTFSMTIGLIAAVRQQTSDSVSVEYYTDYSAGADVGIKIPIKKIVEIKLGGGVKTGRKSADKRETADIKVNERRVSRNYQVDVLEREVVRKTFREVVDETRPVSGGFVISDTIEESLVSSGTETQIGYRLTSKEQKDGSREVWPVMVGRRESMTAARALDHLLDADGMRMAEELARLVDVGF